MKENYNKQRKGKQITNDGILKKSKPYSSTGSDTLSFPDLIR